MFIIDPKLRITKDNFVFPNYLIFSKQNVDILKKTFAIHYNYCSLIMNYYFKQREWFIK